MHHCGKKKNLSLTSLWNSCALCQWQVLCDVHPLLSHALFLTCWHQGSLDNPNLDNASKYLPEQVLRNISIWRGKWQGLLLRDLWQWKIFTALILIPQPVAADGFYTAAAATRAQGASPLPVRSATSVCCWSDYKVKRLLHYAVVTFNVSLLCVQH